MVKKISGGKDNCKLQSKWTFEANWKMTLNQGFLSCQMAQCRGDLGNPLENRKGWGWGQNWCSNWSLYMAIRTIIVKVLLGRPEMHQLLHSTIVYRAMIVRWYDGNRWSSMCETCTQLPILLALSVSVLLVGLEKSDLVTQNLDVRNILAGSHKSISTKVSQSLPFKMYYCKALNDFCVIQKKHLKFWYPILLKMQRLVMEDICTLEDISIVFRVFQNAMPSYSAL
jgi:hypothetical protein